MPRLVFVIRNDGLTKSGGDIDLARQYSKLISSDDLITSIARFSELDLTAVDLVVLFNIDMPFENFLVARECSKRKIPYVIYTLHPKAKHVEDFLRHGTFGAQHVAAFLAGYSLLAFENIACLVRLMKARRWQVIPSYRAAKYCAAYVLANSARVLVSCTSEAEAIQADFGVNPHFEVIPHLVDQRDLGAAIGGEEAPGQRDRKYVLCAGRIEPRKNQMAVVRLAALCPNIHFLFIGKLNTNHPNYAQKFTAAISGGDNTEWRDQVPLAELQLLIRSAQAYINLSWFEVFSLIDLMAMTAKTPSVMSTGSYLHEQMASTTNTTTGIEFVDPNDVPLAQEKLLALPNRAEVPEGVVVDTSWSATEIKKKWVELVSKIHG